MCHRALLQQSMSKSLSVLDVHNETRDVTTHAHGCEGPTKLALCGWEKG